MAKQWTKFGDKLDQEALDALTRSGINFRDLKSDDERIDSALSVLSQSPLWSYKRYDDLHVMKARRDRSVKTGDKFGIENAARIIDTWAPKKEGKKTLSIGDQFYDAYWKADKPTRAFWKNVIEDTLGEGAWDNVKQRINNRLKDETAVKIDKDRRAIVEGNAEDQGAYDKFASVVGGILMPRTKQKALEGKVIEGKDIALDALESAAMALPLGAATWGGKVATAAAIPFASEVLDDIAYKTDNPNDIAERADFNPADMVVGTLVNLVAPEAMNRALRKAGNKFFRGGEGASSDVMDVVKDLKANDRWNLPKDWKAEANELRRIEADQIENNVLSDLKKKAGYLSTDEEVQEAIEKLVSTHDLIEGAKTKGNKKLLKGMLDQLEKNLGDDPELRKAYEAAANSDILDGIDNPAIREAMESSWGGHAPDFRSRLESEMSDYAERTNDIVREVANDQSKLTLDQRKKLLKVDELRNLASATEVLANNNLKKVKIKTPKGTFDAYTPKYPDNFTPSEKIAAGMDDNLDNILAVRNSGADYGDYMSLAHPKVTQTASFAKDVLNTLAANKAGNQSNVERAVTPIESFIGMPGSLSKPVRKYQTEQRENAKKAQAKSVLNAMANNAQTAEDRKWLGIIAENPGIVRGEGAKALDPEFRKWMLIRGSDILRGTELYRPTFEVE